MKRGGEQQFGTNLEDCSGTTRARSPFDRSVAPDGGNTGRQEAMAGRTCNTRNTPRETPNPAPLARNPSSWSSPCIVHTSRRRSARSLSGSRVSARGWNRNGWGVWHTRHTKDTPRGSFFQPPASRTCRLSCGRNPRRSSPAVQTPFSLRPTALETSDPLFFNRLINSFE